MRETPYIILLLLVIVAAALFLGNSDPITAATGRVEVNAVFADVPAGGFIASGLLGALFKIVLSGIGLSISGLVVVQMRKWLRDRQYNSQWKGGPNAQWQQQIPRQPRAKQMDTNQMMQWAMLNRLMPPTQQGNALQSPFVVAQPQPEDNLDLQF